MTTARTHDPSQTGARGDAGSLEAAALGAKEASRRLASLETATKDAVLQELASAIEAGAAAVLDANRADMERARGEGLQDAKLRRLELTRAKVRDMCAGVRQIAALPDPVGRVSKRWTNGAGMEVEKVRTPIGVIAMIYEARPNVTIDAFALCFKAGNACLLKGGREANESNARLAEIARGVLAGHGVPGAALTAVTTSDREEIKGLLRLEGVVDLVIPRGGEGLIRFVHEHARVPTVQHFHGVCHVYVDAAADVRMAVEIAATAKTSAPATCNAAECVLVHESIASEFVPAFLERCRADGVTVRGDGGVRRLAKRGSGVEPAAEEDWGREYLDLVYAARVVGSIDEAMAHIARYGSDHTDVIVTEDASAAARFQREVTSSCVLHNASTRFNDGFSLGLGAEIGISTSKIHAYGPMGLEELTAERYVVRGTGQVR